MYIYLTLCLHRPNMSFILFTSTAAVQTMKLQQEYVQGRKEGWLQKDGNSVKYIAQHGPLAKAIL